MYLTLDGKLPNDQSVYNEKKSIKMKDGIDYHLISYKENISSWLKECMLASKHLPLLSETIHQYDNLIKCLTGQSMNENEISEVVETVILNGEYTKAAMEISNSIDRAKKLLLMRFALEIKQNIISKLPDVITEINNSFGEQYAGINFSFQEKKSSWIQLSFLSRLGLTYLEICNDENYDHDTKKIIKNINLVNNYKNELECASAWGKVENVEKAWHGDWVCRYYKLDNYLRNPNTWADFANFNLELSRIVSNDIEKLLMALKKYGK